ncbi:MAG: FAD:protein FMN transferase [Phycisphaerae bacterium]|nr:FAD:protein FMN transferase [Phycisphaerae bacterium]
MSGKSSWSRRGFFTARGLGACTGGLVAELLPDGPAPRSVAPSATANLCVARRAMACEFNVFLPPSVPLGIAAAEAALDTIDEYENLLTVYSGSSPMSYVNQTAANGPVRVDNRLFELLTRAEDLHEQTGGAFDIAAGALVKAWGFFDGAKRVPAEPERQAALARIGMRHVILDRAARTVHYRTRGVEINLGSIGKGYAIDRAVSRLRGDFGVPAALVQGGLSSLYGLGSPDGDERGWLVGIQNPWDAGRLVASVRLRDRALGTSSASNQYFEQDGRRFGHVLDPRTGWPAEGLASASAICDDAATADALATAFFVMGLDKTRDFCHNHPAVAALLVLQPGDSCGTSDPPQVVTFNLPKKDVNLDPGDSLPPAGLSNVVARPGDGRG